MVQQQAKSSKCVNNIDTSTCKIKQAIASQFPKLFSRIALWKTYAVKSKLQQKITATPQKGGCISINLQPRVTAELDRSQKEADIEKLSSCSDKIFISTTVFTVKKIKL